MAGTWRALGRDTTLPLAAGEAYPLDHVALTVRSDLLRLALHANVLSGRELRQLAECLQDAGVHVGEVPQEIEDGEDNVDLGVEQGSSAGVRTHKALANGQRTFLSIWK